MFWKVRLIGIDEFGNRYCKKMRKDKEIRFVKYKGLAEPSKVPCMWHAWLHYMITDNEVLNIKKLPWQKRHTPNLTGTKYAYYPSGATNVNYKPWTL